METAAQKRRKQIKLFSWSGAVLVAAILLVLNFVVSYIPIRWDTSKGNIYSISSGSKSIVKKLDDTLLVRIMFSSDLPANYRLNEKYLADLLSEYKRASGGKIRIEYFDPSQSPRGREEAMAHGVLPVQLDVRERDRREVKECFMGVAFLYGDKKGSIPLVQDSQNLEYEITVQIKKLVDPAKPTIGVVNAGGAVLFTDKSLQPLYDAVDKLYSLQNLDLTQPIPETIKALWILGPSKPLELEKIETIKSYLNRGGSVGVLLDRRDVVITEFRTSANPADLSGLLSHAGLQVRDGLISDPTCDRIQIRASQGAFQMINVVDYPYIPILVDVDRTHPATKGIEAFTMPYVSPIDIVEPKASLTYTVLARTSAASFLDTSPIMVNPLQERYRAPDAPVGPFNVGVVVEGKFDSSASTEAAVGRLIVLGTSRLIRTEYPVKQPNFSLFMNLIDWSGQDDVLLQIRSKGTVQKPIKPLSDSLRLFLKSLMIFGLPLFSLLAGVLVWRRQKVRRALMPLQYQDRV